jgi:hypothetical protein
VSAGLAFKFGIKGFVQAFFVPSGVSNDFPSFDFRISGAFGRAELIRGQDGQERLRL